MKSLWIGVAVVAAVAVGGYVAVRSRIPDLGPAGPNRDLAPDSVAVYVETSDLAATWSKMQTTDAWRDLKDSKAAAALLDLAAVKDFVGAVDQVAAKAAYPLDAANAMKFVGREFSVGAELDAGGGAPRLLVLTKLDIDALTKDLVKGKTDLSALWEELQRRTAQCDFVVTREEYRDHVIAVAARGASKFHAALLGDTLAVATDGALLRKAVDCRATHGERSLGRKPSFQADLAAIPAARAAFEWYDFDALDAGRTSLDAGFASLGASPEVVGAAHGVLDGVRGARSCARATTLADGDLYKLTWTYSKSADLFADKAKPALRNLFSGEWIAYGEIRDVGAVATAYEKSALRRKLEEGELGKWFREQMDKPATTLGDFSDLLGGAAPAARPAPAVGRPVAKAPEVRPGTKKSKPAAGQTPPQPTPPAAAPPAAVGTKAPPLDPFVKRFAWHLIKERLRTFVDGEAAFAADAAADANRPDKAPRLAFAARLDTDARLIALAAQGALLASKTAGATCEDCGQRKMFGADAPKTRVSWTLVGDALVLSNDASIVRQAALVGDTKPPGPPQDVRDAVAAMKPGWRGLLHLDYGRLMAAAMGSRNADAPKSPFDFAGIRLTLAAYVPDDFSSVEVRTRTLLPDAKNEEARAILGRLAPREPRCWTALPDTTFAHATYPSGGVDSIWFLVKLAAKAGGADMAAAEASIDEKLGMSVEKQLIPALGQELVFAVTYCAADAAKPKGKSGAEQVVLPGFMLGVEVKDAATVKRAVDRALEIAEEQLRESDASMSHPFVREPRDGAEIVRLELPPQAQEQVKLSPALAIHDGFLFVSSDVDALRAGIDAAAGKAKSVADTPAFVRATASLDKKCACFELLDWPRMLDQAAVYAPQLGRSLPRAEVKYPEYPEDGNKTEWLRRMKDYEQRLEDAKNAGGEKAVKWIDALRVIDFVGVSMRVEGRSLDAVISVKFSD